MFPQVPDLERKVDQLEEELNYLSAKKDLNKLDVFIQEISGKVLHPQHYLMLIARRNYKILSHKMLIRKLTTCDTSMREELKDNYKKKAEDMNSLAWVAKSLLGEEYNTQNSEKKI